MGAAPNEAGLMRVLVTGAAGMLGHELVSAFSDHEVTGLAHRDLDVSDRAAVLDAVNTIKPGLILHAAAWTAVDACESDPDKAFAVNALGSAHIAEAAEKQSARVVTYSTDYVFDGELDRAYSETDSPSPQSVYGHSKLRGEQAFNDQAVIMRISWVCGYYGANMVKTILRLANENPILRFVDDQIGYPTFAADAAAMTRLLVDQERYGLYHVTNQGEVSWFEFAQEVLKAAGLDPERVEPITTASLNPPRPAKRPANSRLENSGLKRDGIGLLPDFREPLALLVARLRDEK